MGSCKPLPVCGWILLAAAALVLRSDPASAAEVPGNRWGVNTEAGQARSPSDSRLRVGALAGVGLPRPLTFEALVGVDRTLAIGGEYSFLPRSTIGGVDTSFWAIAGDARIFPFGGPFFVGFRGGHQQLGGSTTATVGTFGVVTESMTVDTWFINPRIGLLWMWDSWFALGMEAGLQIPLTWEFSSSIPSGSPNDARMKDAAGTLTSALDTLGTSVLPTIDLLRIGFIL
jgi:hypothetical protein